MFRTLRQCAYGLILGSLYSSAASAGNWPEWRGPNNQGISPETGLPTEWGDVKDVAWKLKLPGVGGCSPAVWGNRLFVTSEDGKDTVLLCIDAVKGKEIWKNSLGPIPNKVKFMAEENNGATPSPSTDGQHVWAVSGAGILSCFDMDGKEIWTLDAQKKYGKFQYQFGMHTTPVLDGDRLYWFLIHSKPGLVFCFDAKTGKEIWKVERPSDGIKECEHSYASPLIYRKGDLAYLVVHGNDYCTAHALDDGREIWRVGGLNSKEKYNPTFRFVASPVVTPDLIVVPSCKSGPVVGVKPTAQGTFATGSPFEQFRMVRNTPDVPSPLVKDGLVYLCRENGRLMCLDALTGQEYYQETLHSAKYRASPVYADGNLYLTARDGVVSVVKAGREFKLVAENKLNDSLVNSPAVSNGRIYFRGYDYLWAIGNYRVAN